jgi:signal transduction histidine kinase
MPKPRRALLSLNDLLTNGLSFLQSTFDNAHITVYRRLYLALPAIHGDEAQLWQAILNLIRNAIEAMPTGGALTLATRHEPGFVHLEITDTGKGIDPATFANLFKPFYSTKPSGTGLGLPLTQQIITEHGGRIHCETSPDRGTTFHIQLPTP